MYGDRSLLTRVVDNLVSNAFHYTDAGGVIRMRATQNSDGAQVQIQDTGKGIAPEDAARIFDKFYRASDTGKHTNGLGLGLALCKLAVQAHGGKIWVESKPGAGSMFSFTLPAKGIES
jgi:signal transduction histidine kinase